MNIDIERIKNEISIESLIGQTYTLENDGGGRLRAKEHDSLKIWPKSNNWAWYSQSGKNGKALGGSVIDWHMHTHNCSVDVAIRELGAMLDGHATAPAPPRPAIQRRPPEPPAWQSPAWQQKSRAMVDRGIEMLHCLPGGQPGRDYLASRGISLDMALAYDIGFGMVWNGKAQKSLPALLIPWRNRHITAIQYRFIGVGKDDDSAGRFGQLGGGQRFLFGLQHCMNPADDADDQERKLHTLIIVEGELNAVSIMQVVYGMRSVGVVSYGPQSNINNPQVAKHAATVAGRYEHVIVWADEPEIALQAIGHIHGAIPVKSPNGMDANDLLVAGRLDDVVFRLLQQVENTK